MCGTLGDPQVQSTDPRVEVQEGEQEAPPYHASEFGPYPAGHEGSLNYLKRGSVTIRSAFWEDGSGSIVENRLGDGQAEAGRPFGQINGSGGLPRVWITWWGKEGDRVEEAWLAGGTDKESGRGKSVTTPRLLAGE